MDREPDETINIAARWIATERVPGVRAVVPDVRTRFGLDTLSACEAIRRANLLRMEARDASGS